MQPDSPTPEPVLVDVRDRVALITLNRPERLNAFTEQMGSYYAQALRDADADPGVRVAVVTGSGRGFCSGADLSVLAQGPDALDGFVSDTSWDDLPTGALEVSIPVVMAVNGPAAGLGFVIALTGDVCFASPSARFISAFSRLGLVAEYGVAWLLPRLIGRQRAAELLFSGRPVDAEEAERIGLVQGVHDDVVGAAMAWARDVATHCSPGSLATMKRQLSAAQTGEFHASISESLELMRESFRGPDLAEALQAKAAGRAPEFGPSQSS
ncbi:MAG: enoyl-CoA hydratase [Actinobacteria bacterium]|nr:enoyl-CoA hydratase [Actinomycetota bacterium]